MKGSRLPYLLTVCIYILHSYVYTYFIHMRINTGLLELQEKASADSVQLNEINELRFTNIKDFTETNTAR
jgi:hypothetical protein